MGFFTYFDILESYVINLRGQENIKTQKLVQGGARTHKNETRPEEICVHLARA